MLTLSWFTIGPTTRFLKVNGLVGVLVQRPSISKSYKSLTGRFCLQVPIGQMAGEASLMVQWRVGNELPETQQRFARRLCGRRCRLFTIQFEASHLLGQNIK